MHHFVQKHTISAKPTYKKQVLEQGFLQVQQSNSDPHNWAEILQTKSLAEKSLENASSEFKTETKEPYDKNNNLKDCPYWKIGKCYFGDHCKLRHDPKYGFAATVYELCKFYMLGSCKKNQQCQYMHKSYPCKYYHLIAQILRAVVRKLMNLI